MKNRIKSIFLVLFSLAISLSFSLKAAHIVGGDMYYECLGNDTYRIHLKVYRDCYAFGPNVAGFDDPAFVGIYDVNGTLVQDLSVFLTNGPTNIPPETADPCLSPPPDVCVEEGVFTFDQVLPPSPGGYDIIYVRCCRNNTIVNIFTPEAVGATYLCHIPDPGIASCNSSPYFVDFPPIVICANEPLNFDHSAIDPDGDSLVYEFCHPYTGADRYTPKPTPVFNLGTLDNVDWRTTYSTTNPLRASPSMNIDPVTGLLTGTPSLQGQFVVGICVKEFRNGILIGETKRDFQFNVTTCSPNVQALIPVIDTLGSAATSTAGVYVRQCDGFDVQFINNSINGSFYNWDFGLPNVTSDTSTLEEPRYTYPDTGTYVAKLVVNRGSSCSDSIAVLVHIYPIFNTDYDFLAGCSNVPVQFTDQTTTSFGFINSWTWDFGDGASDNVPNPVHTYTQGGNYQATLISTSSKGCVDIKSYPITVLSTPKPDFIYSPPCIDLEVSFIDQTTITSGSIGSWEWFLDGTFYDVSQNTNATFDDIGDVEVLLIAKSDENCIDSINKTITVNPLPIVAIGNDTAICHGQYVQLSASGGVLYQWTPSGSLDDATLANPTASPTVNTSFIAQITDTNQCENMDSVFVTVNPLPLVDAGADTFICLGDSYQLNGSGGITFHWKPESAVSDAALPNPTVAPDSTMAFLLTTQNTFGCIDSDLVVIEVQQPIDFDAIGEQDICVGDTLQLWASGGKYYEWLPANGINGNDSSNYFVQPSITTTYEVSISNDCDQFTKVHDVEVVVHELPFVDAGADDTIYRDEFTLISGTGNGVEYTWFPEHGLTDAGFLTTEASPFNTTDYTLTMINEHGCKNSDIVTVYVEVLNVLVVPTAFSPNQDGSNEQFYILRHLNVDPDNLEIMVFNRWGQKVFSGSDPDQRWDGTHNGEPAPMGVYVFFIQGLNKDGDPIERSGNLTLVR